ncbi:hypothetical protein MRB53_016451 [Persea americana]|uniref:Uncharacterized protein n=1 Tax=Persea americana TaxID=3435 RepID=A0ACC2M255_PERAE|nr:hypothetical protein MRB53_016451 [Persea americana]
MEKLVNDAFRRIGEHADSLMDDLIRNGDYEDNSPKYQGHEDHEARRCVTHAQYACPICVEGTVAERLKSGKKYSYQGTRKFLPIDHVFKTQKAAFNNKSEEGRPPRRLSGSELEAKVSGIQMDIGKSKGKKRKSYGDESTDNITT